MGKQNAKVVGAWTLRVLSVPLFLGAGLMGLAAVFGSRAPSLNANAAGAMVLVGLGYFVLCGGAGLLLLWFAKRLIRSSGKPEGTHEA